MGRRRPSRSLPVGLRRDEDERRSKLFSKRGPQSGFGVSLDLASAGTSMNCFLKINGRVTERSGEAGAATHCRNEQHGEINVDAI